MNKKNWLKLGLFLTIFCILFSKISLIFTFENDKNNYHWISGFFEEKKDSLDVVFVGSSDVYAFWQAPLAYESYGVTSYPLSCDSQPFIAARYLIDDARKQQPDALYVVVINTLVPISREDDNFSEPSTLHFVLDYYPLSSNKLKLTWRLTDLGNYSYSDRLEFFLPIIRYHSVWYRLSETNFNFSFLPFKGGDTYDFFLNRETDISDSYHSSSTTATLDETRYETVIELLKYCKEKNLNVLFVTMPRASSEETAAIYNATEELIESYDFPVLDLMDKVDELGLDLTKDYYNKYHTNIHGSIKVTNYIAKYLVDNYGFTDKRNTANLEDWENAVKSYHEIIDPYLTSDELNALSPK